jgi:F-type H+-transporting ATPase subunit epsilon
MSPFRLEVVTAERELYSGDVDQLIAPSRQGQVTILPNHAPLLSQLEAGLLEYRVNGEDQALAVTGGFMEVMGNRTVILADSAERAEEIDEARAQAAFDKAEERMASRDTDVDFERAVRQLARARTRLTVARRRRPMAPIPPTG